MAAPGRLGGLLGLVRRLIVYGKNLAVSLRQPVAATDLTRVTGDFGTRDIALILARITRGLLLAAALEAKLIRCVAREAARPEARAPEQTAVDTPAQAAPVTEASPRKSRAARTAAPQTARRTNDDASLLARMPTPEEIAALVRRRPIGAVLADICSDLGIVTSHPLWRELRDAVIFNGGSLLRMMRNFFGRSSILGSLPPDFPLIPPMPPGWQPPPRLSFAEALGTGPP